MAKYDQTKEDIALEAYRLITMMIRLSSGKPADRPAERKEIASILYRVKQYAGIGLK